MEQDPAFDFASPGCWNCGSESVVIPISDTPGGRVDYYNHKHKNAFVYGRCESETGCASNPPNAPWGVYFQGTGLTSDNKYIMKDYNQLTNNPDNLDTGRAVFTYVDNPKPSCAEGFLTRDKTIVVSLENAKGGDFGCGKRFYIEGFDGIFTVTDSGSEVANDQFDIYVGEILKSEFDKEYGPITHTKHRIAPAT